MSALSPAAQARQAQLFRRYLHSLPGKCDRIKTYWRQLQSDGWSADSLARLKVEAHRLAGSAGNHDLPKLGEAALSLEASLKAGCDSPEDRRLVEKYFTNLVQALEAAARGGPRDS